MTLASVRATPFVAYEPARPTSSDRGHLTLKSCPPLPRFACSIPVPPASASIHQLRSTVVSILTGDKSTKKSSSASTVKDASALSFSEHLKQETIKEWRMKGVVLELRQNEVIAPETRGNGGLAEGEVEDNMTGFELLDVHECALIEHGDEIRVRLRNNHTLDSLRLPPLPKNHSYGLPTTKSEVRKEQRLKSITTSAVAGDPYTSGAPSQQVLQPSEPSSHSSSVSAHPEVQFSTKTRHSATAGNPRVVVLGNAGNGSAPQKSKTPRQNTRTSNAHTRLSSPNHSPLHAHVPLAPRRSDSSSHPARNRSSSAPGPPSPLSSPPAQGATSPDPSGAPSSSETSAKQQQQTETHQTTNGDTRPSVSKVDKQERERLRKAGQRGMPSDALVIGPGVQGRIGPGHIVSFDNNKVALSTSEEKEGYGNMDAFVSFTAASGEVQARQQPSNTRNRLRSPKRSASNPGPSLRENEDEQMEVSKSKQKSVKQYVDLPDRPQLPPIQNLSPFNGSGVGDVLLPMPSAADSPTVFTDGEEWLDVDAVSSEGLQRRESTGAKTLDRESKSQKSSKDDDSSPLPLSKAEKRYNEVRKNLQAEMDKQADQDRQRKERVRKKEEDMVKAAQRFEEEQRVKKEKLKWQTWQEVRTRQAKEREQAR